MYSLNGTVPVAQWGEEREVSAVYGSPSYAVSETTFRSALAF